MHLARIGSKQPIDEARSHERIKQKNGTNGAHKCGIPGWLGNEKRGQEEKGDDDQPRQFAMKVIRIEGKDRDARVKALRLLVEETHYALRVRRAAGGGGRRARVAPCV